MRLAALALAVLAACSADHNPPAGGGGGGGGGTGGSADAGGSSGADAAVDLVGQLCDAPDLRDPLACRPSNLTGLDVTALPGAQTTTAAADGIFVVPGAAAATTLEVGTAAAATRDALIRVAAWRGSDGLVAPTISQIAWNSLIAGLAALEPDGSASIALYLVDATTGDPVVGAEVIAPAGTSNAPYYDGASAVDWPQGVGTGAAGAALLIGVAADAPTVTVVVVSGAATVELSVPVLADHLTFERRAL
jgi:hypothetical protein